MTTVRSRNPMEICIFSILAVSSFGSASRILPLPRSLDVAGPMGRFAALALFVGCVLAVSGILWRTRGDGLVVEQLGCALAGFGCAFYAAALLGLNTWPQTALGVGTALGIAVFCGFRYVQIDRYVRVHRDINRGLHPRRSRGDARGESE